MKRKVFMVNPYIFGLFLVCGVMVMPASVALAFGGKLAGAALFFVISCWCLWEAAKYGAIIEFDSEGVLRTTAFFFKTRWLWSEIAEVGVCGTKVFNNHNKNKVGTLYFYISKDEMDDDDRFAMLLKWPARDKLFVKYSSKCLVALQLGWRSKITKYNIGNRRIEEVTWEKT